MQKLITVARQPVHKSYGSTFKVFNRTIFKKFRETPKKLANFDESEGFHHEYSIRPDTFVFKVSGANERSRSVVDIKKERSIHPTDKKVHPLQKNNSKNGFNAVDFIYRNSTNYPFNERSPQEVFNEYPLTNSSKLARRLHRPKKIKMLASDFIDDSLYNPNYGYFSQEVEIFHPDQPFDYNNISDVDDFMDSWQKAYSKYDEMNPKAHQAKQKLRDIAKQNEDSKETDSKLARRAKEIYKKETELVQTGQFSQTKRSLQLWHTPTELFQPYYGEALARYLLVNYKLNGYYPYNDLIIYEMGGGNGTLMCNILNYIKENQPDVYARTQYKIIEILSQLAEKQYSNALKSKLILQGLDSLKLEIINKSIFNWDRIVEDPCFFIALEVFDNFAHDLIRYDNVTGEPYEGHVLIDEHGDFYEFFTPELSYYSNAFLQLRENGQYPVLKHSDTVLGKIETAKSMVPFVTNKDKIHPLYHSSQKLKTMNYLLPFKDNLTPGEFIPTKLLHFFQILKHKFPQHSLICSDFHFLPNSINGYYNAPVVQTVIQDKMVDITTYMCYQGYFDIMFPTDFGVAGDLYKQVTGKVPRVELHHDFLEHWADTDITSTKKGENPMLDFYTNVSFMVS